MTVAFFTTCLADTFHPRAAVAAVRVLEHLGERVSCPPGQTCCGQPMLNGGHPGAARTLARRMIGLFAPWSTVVTPSASCAAMVREHYPALFPPGSAGRDGAEALAAKTFEWCEYLHRVRRVDLRRLGARWPGSATWHASCHQRGLDGPGRLGAREAALELIAQIEGLRYRPLEKREQCCGFGGAFAVKYETISGAMVADKVRCIERAGAATVICNDAGCSMNIAGACRRRGAPVQLRSLAEIVAEGLGLLERTGSPGSGHGWRPGPDPDGPPSPSPEPEPAASDPGPARDGHPLEPPLPFDMKPRAARASRDVQLQQFVNSATGLKDQGRERTLRDAFGADYDRLRRLAGHIKQHALDHLDVYLERFVDRATEAGATVHFAADGAQANAICAEIAERRASRLCVKSKSMVTEETGLVPALEALGIETIETDLGEFIIQLDGDAPSHIVTPMIHKDRRSVARAFRRELGAPYTEDPEALTAIARAHLREKYRRADLGLSGANFLVAETGTVVVVTNEGNADLAVAGPRVHVVMAGIEKIVPERRHLPVFLKLLARSATSQPITVYTTLVTGPRRPHEPDGPEEVHVILVDNGRSGLLAPETRELLRCIRCGACLNACPVYRKVGGGHAYGAVYSGPIGAVITPLFKGLHNYPDLPQASSLCGACREACPVDIDIPRHLLRLRALLAGRGLVPASERRAYALWAAILARPRLYAAATRLARTVLRRAGAAADGADPLDDRLWLSRLPGPLAGWTACRDFPAPTSQSFRSWWARRARS